MKKMLALYLFNSIIVSIVFLCSSVSMGQVPISVSEAFVSGFNEGYTTSMRKYIVEEIVFVAENLSKVAHAANGGRGAEVPLSFVGNFEKQGLDATLTLAGKPDGKYNTSAVVIKLMKPDPELCKMIMSKVPNTAPTSPSDTSAKAGYYVSHCS